MLHRDITNDLRLSLALLGYRYFLLLSCASCSWHGPQVYVHLHRTFGNKAAGVNTAKSRARLRYTNQYLDYHGTRVSPVSVASPSTNDYEIGCMWIILPS